MQSETVSAALPAPISDAPSKEELASRLAKVQGLIEEESLDTYVSFDPVNIYYLTHFANNVHERPFLLVIPKRGTPTMVAPLLETSHVKARARCELDYATYYEFPAPSKARTGIDIYGALIDRAARAWASSPAMPVGICERTPGRDGGDRCHRRSCAWSSREYEIGRNVHACKIVELWDTRRSWKPAVRESSRVRSTLRPRRR